MKQSRENDTETEKVAQAAGAFAGVCGTLAGFSIAFIILVLTPPRLINTDMVQECVVTLLLISSFLYINASGMFANASRYSSRNIFWIYNLALIFFHISNVLILISILPILGNLSLPFSTGIGILLVFAAIVIFLINLLAMFQSSSSRKIARLNIMEDKEEYRRRHSMSSQGEDDERS